MYGCPERAERHGSEWWEPGSRIAWRARGRNGERRARTARVMPSTALLHSLTHSHSHWRRAESNARATLTTTTHNTRSHSSVQHARGALPRLGSGLRWCDQTHFLLSFELFTHERCVLSRSFRIKEINEPYIARAFSYLFFFPNHIFYFISAIKLRFL